MSETSDRHNLDVLRWPDEFDGYISDVRRKMRQRFDEACPGFASHWQACPFCGVLAEAVNVRAHEEWHLENLR